jgi:hypothetical protein
MILITFFFNKSNLIKVVLRNAAENNRTVTEVRLKNKVF